MGCRYGVDPNTGRLVLPIPLSVNGLVVFTSRGLRKHPQAQAWARDARVWAALWAKDQGWQMTRKRKVVLQVWTYWPDAHYRDTHNLYKVLLDGLQGVLYDNDYWVLVRQEDFQVDAACPRVELWLEVVPRRNHDG